MQQLPCSDRSSPVDSKKTGPVPSSPIIVEKPEPRLDPLPPGSRLKPTHFRLDYIVLAPRAVGPPRNHLTRKQRSHLELYET